MVTRKRRGTAPSPVLARRRPTSGPDVGRSKSLVPLQVHGSMGNYTVVQGPGKPVAGKPPTHRARSLVPSNGLKGCGYSVVQEVPNLNGGMKPSTKTMVHRQTEKGDYSIVYDTNQPPRGPKPSAPTRLTRTRSLEPAKIGRHDVQVVVDARAKKLPTFWRSRTVPAVSQSKIRNGKDLPPLDDVQLLGHLDRLKDTMSVFKETSRMVKLTERRRKRLGLRPVDLAERRLQALAARVEDGRTMTVRDDERIDQLSKEGGSSNKATQIMMQAMTNQIAKTEAQDIVENSEGYQRLVNLHGKEELIKQIAYQRLVPPEYRKVGERSYGQAMDIMKRRLEAQLNLTGAPKRDNSPTELLKHRLGRNLDYAGARPGDRSNLSRKLHSQLGTEASIHQVIETLPPGRFVYKDLMKMSPADQALIMGLVDHVKPPAINADSAERLGRVMAHQETMNDLKAQYCLGKLDVR